MEFFVVTVLALHQVGISEVGEQFRAFARSRGGWGSFLSDLWFVDLNSEVDSAVA